jgi:hypothetical protein
MVACGFRLTGPARLRESAGVVGHLGIDVVGYADHEARFEFPGEGAAELAISGATVQYEHGLEFVETEEAGKEAEELTLDDVLAGWHPVVAVDAEGKG